MGNTPNIDSSTIAKSAINQAKINSSEYRNNPNWVNDYTRLNAENVNKMRENIYKYVEEVTTQSLVQENEVVKDLVEDTVGEKYPNNNSTGEIFNDYENNQASGDYSHVGGTNSEASGKASFTHGINLKATAQAQAVFGQFNEQNDNALFIVGNGTYSNHNNAFEVLDTGSATLQTQGTTDNSLVINKTLNNKVSEINNSITAITEDITNINGDITDIRGKISNALHFRGVFASIEAAESSLTDIVNGDVIIVTKDSSGDNNTSNEYVYVNGNWEKLGDASDFLLKTEAEGIYVPQERTIAGLDLKNNISVQDLSNKLNLSNYVPVNRTIANVDLTDNISKDELLSALELVPLGRRLITDNKYNSNIYFDNNTIEKLYSEGSFSIGESNTIVTTRFYGMLGKGKLTWTLSGQQQEYIHSADPNAILFAPNGSKTFTNDIINKKIVFMSNTNTFIDAGVIESKVLNTDGNPVIINGSRHCYIIKDTNPDIDYSTQTWVLAILLNCEQVIGADFPKQVNNVLMLGNNLVSTSSNSLILGKYNEYSKDFNNKLIVAGNGSETERKTVYELDVNGNATHQGVVKAQSYQLLDGSSLNTGIVDSALSTTSINAIQNKVVTTKFNDIDTVIGTKTNTELSNTLWSSIEMNYDSLTETNRRIDNLVSNLETNYMPTSAIEQNYSTTTSLQNSIIPAVIGNYITTGTAEPTSSTTGKIYIQIHN